MTTDTLRLDRYIHGNNATIGKIIDPANNKFICYTVERSRYGTPCRIDAGTYKVSLYYSPSLHAKLVRKGLTEQEARLKSRVWQLHNVPGRTAIQIHIGNSYTELRGCIAPGLSVAKNKEGVQSSGLAFNRLVSYLGSWDKVWYLEVKDA